MTHGPPYNILDLVDRNDENVGCESLTQRLPSLKPRLHLFGHIHEAHGAEIRTYPLKLEEAPPTSVDTTAEHTLFVNAANWPAGHRVRRIGGKVQFASAPFQPVVVDLLDEVPA